MSVTGEALGLDDVDVGGPPLGAPVGPGVGGILKLTIDLSSRF